MQDKLKDMTNVDKQINPSLDLNSLERTNKISIKVPKFFEPTDKITWF